uniref:Cytochrome P450 n=1 Tax=Heterorhabditis bacteriophora TaxID=37862 RepID=A0A1I7W7K4_HETBA
MEDETQFENPREFNPDRYATGGKSLEQQVIPFGLGKRSCLGESLARAELYLILGNMLQRYNISEDPMKPVEIRSITPFGMMHRPQGYNFLISAAS